MYMCTQYLPHIHPPTPFPPHPSPFYHPPAQTGPVLPSYSDFVKKPSHFCLI
jgi:hypothetical protein